MIGRLRLPASTLFLSTLGLPDASLGSFSATIVPHSAPPQSATRTVALPSSVSQVPLGSAANAGANKAAMRTAALVARRRCVDRCMGVPFWVGRLDRRCSVDRVAEKFRQHRGFARPLAMVIAPPIL